MKQTLIMMIISIVLYGQVASTGHIVIDSKTSLEWQDDQEAFKVEWNDAINYCETLELDNHTDWRLPNINELKTIVDSSKDVSIINGFEQIGEEGSLEYWTSTSVDATPSSAWIIYFSSGAIGGISKNSSCYFRCVRNKDSNDEVQCPEGTHNDGTENCVPDDL